VELHVFEYRTNKSMLVFMVLERDILLLCFGEVMLHIAHEITLSFPVVAVCSEFVHQLLQCNRVFLVACEFE
jgi:hypothetical protein